MSGFSIGEVESITGIKPHILRYWENVIPSLAPKMDVGGHRLYTQRDVDILRRLKFLVYTKGLNVEAAWKTIVHQSNLYEKKSVLVAIQKCRGELNNAYLQLQKLKHISKNYSFQRMQKKDIESK